MRPGTQGPRSIRIAPNKSMSLSEVEILDMNCINITPGESNFRRGPTRVSVVIPTRTQGRRVQSADETAS